MRISDWSSDVCSSGLQVGVRPPGGRCVKVGERRGAEAFAIAQNPALRLTYRQAECCVPAVVAAELLVVVVTQTQLGAEAFALEIGRASCRERVCQSV